MVISKTGVSSVFSNQGNDNNTTLESRTAQVDS